MIAHYIVTNETHKVMMILRPYQYFTTEAIIHQVKTLTITLTFGTPQVRKTLTSFNASQIVMELPDVYKVVFVVDRKDLDYQTMTEFNAFKKRQC
jgi:type I restriction enzyme R subunit